MDRVETRIANRLEELGKIVPLVDGFGASHGIAKPVIDALNLVLDEVLNNIISYGYPDGGAGTIRVRLECGPGVVRAEIEDDGIAFDWPRPGPLDRAVPTRGRAVGGAGLRFIHGLTDEIFHERIAGRNRLLLTKRIPLAT